MGLITSHPSPTLTSVPDPHFRPLRPRLRPQFHPPLTEVFLGQPLIPDRYRPALRSPSSSPLHSGRPGATPHSRCRPALPPLTRYPARLSGGVLHGGPTHLGGFGSGARKAGRFGASHAGAGEEVWGMRSSLIWSTLCRRNRCERPEVPNTVYNFSMQV